MSEVVKHHAQSLTFLLADDHAPSRAALREMVAAHPDWQVIAEAGDGLQATRLAAGCAPDVVLMDVVMPELNGFRATRRIKSLAPETRVILFSGYANRGFRQGSREAGADFFIQKEDLTARMLDEIVNRILSAQTEDRR